MTDLSKNRIWLERMIKEDMERLEDLSNHLQTTKNRLIDNISDLIKLKGNREKNKNGI